MFTIILKLFGLLATCAWRKFPSSAGLMRGFSRQHIEKVASGCVVVRGTLLPLELEWNVELNVIIWRLRKILEYNEVEFITCEMLHTINDVQ